MDGQTKSDDLQTVVVLVLGRKLDIFAEKFLVAKYSFMCCIFEFTVTIK